MIYSSSPVYLSKDGACIRSSMFRGSMRFAVLSNSDSKCGEILDRFSPCYPVRGDAGFTEPFCVEYTWETKGHGDLLIRLILCTLTVRK